MKFFIKDFFSKYDQIYSFVRIWSHLLKKFLMESFIFLRSVWENAVTKKTKYDDQFLWNTVKYLKHTLHNKSLFKRAKELATISNDWGWISKV